MDTSTSFQVLIVLVVTLGMHPGAQAFTITVTSPNPPYGNSPNTFIGTSDQIASSLLDSGTPAILWGLVNSDDVDVVCKQVVDADSMSFSATVVDSLTQATEDLDLQIENTGGCEASSDESGTEAVMTDNYGRTSALVCPANAGSIGCAVYLTGDDVNDLYYQGSRRRLLASRSRKLLDCQDGAGKGAISGVVTGFISGLGSCAELGPLAPFCVVGVMGATAEIGAASGCASGAVCFPGDATVEMAGGKVKQMTELGLGDKVAIRKRDGSIAYEDIYAFGHRDPKATFEFLKLTMMPIGINTSETHEKQVLEISALHFAPVSSDISTTVKQGLYNPFTMSGTIVVNNVLASVHSEWFLDGVFDFLGLTHLLPFAYQVTLAPARILYTLLGKNNYVALYTWLELQFNFVELVSDYSGAASFSTIVAIVALCTLFVNKKKAI